MGDPKVLSFGCRNCVRRVRVTLARMVEKLNVGVVGGSIGGLFIAALLTRNGHQVTVMERSRHGLARRGAGLVAQQELLTLLQNVGRSSASRVGVVADERITLDRAGRVVFRDPAPQMQLSWDHLYEVLRELVPADSYLLDHAVRAVRSTDVSAEVEAIDGERRFFDVVIGADGLGSVTREAVVPDERGNRYVGYVTWRGLIPEHAIAGRAAETLLGRFAFFTAPGAHMLGYLVPGPLGEVAPGRRRYNWVWYRPVSVDDLADLMQSSGRPVGSLSLAPGDLPGPVLEQLRRDARRELPPEFVTVVEAEPRPFLQAIVDFVPSQMVRHRVALLGDAAVVVRPHTAMGASKAAGDALTLAGLLERLPVLDALERYQLQRLPVGRSIAQYGQRLGDSLPLTRAQERR